MSNQNPLTPPQQAAAIDRIKENLSVRSGAGAGKTLVLARRFTELLLAEAKTNPLLRLVALTFTDKASLEMTQRVREMLENLAAGATGDDRHKLLNWLAQLPEARISTIHSFCGSLLRTHAVTAGIDPNFSVCADTLLIAAMQTEAADEAVLRAVQLGKAEVLDLLRSIRYGELIKLVDRLMSLRTDSNLDRHLDPADSIKLWQGALSGEQEKLRERLSSDADLPRQVQQLEDIPCTDSSDKLLIWRDQAIEAARKILSDDADTESFGEAFGQLAAVKTKTSGSAKAWEGFAPKEVRNEIKKLQEAFAGYSALALVIGPDDELAARALATVVQLAVDANDLFTGAKRKRGLLDFTDLLYYTHQLLAVDTDLAKRLSFGIDQLLIDECQDTNSFQLRMLLGLIFGDDRMDNWPEGKLFVVGDAKQSIYRFRGAQVEVFEQLCNRLGPARQENLDTSFRTHQAGIEFVNHLFAKLIPGYEPIKAHRTINPPENSVEILLARDADGQSFRARQSGPGDSAQAAITAQRITEMIEGDQKLVWNRNTNSYRQAAAGDIAILFSRRTNSHLYERELAKRNIPYYVVAGTGFYKQQEIYDVLCALRAIDNPFDDIALVGVLRSSLIGLDDEALVHITQACSRPIRPSLQEKLAATDNGPRIDIPGLDERQQLALGFAIDLIENLSRRKDAVGIAALIEELTGQTGYEAALLTQFEGRRKLSNFRKVIALARQAGTSLMTLAEFIAQMDQRTIDDSRYEQAAVAGEADNVVRLMTIHSAKGLEFPVVFLPDLNTEHKSIKDTLINRLDFGLTLKHDARSIEQKNDSKDSGVGLGGAYLMAKQLEQADQEAEDIRKLYVAVTRHEDRLVFVAADWRTKDGRFQPTNSVISKLDSAFSVTEALEAGLEKIPYCDGRFSAGIRLITPAKLKRRGGEKSPGQKILSAANNSQELAEKLLSLSQASAPPPKLLGPLDGSTGKVELAATALSDFAICPMLFRWRHELRVPAQPGRQPKQAIPSPAPLDAATMGTLLHRCMELLDLTGPPNSQQLIRRVLGEMDLDSYVDPELLTAQFQPMLVKFFDHELCRRIQTSTRQYRELDFVYQAGRAVIRGQIDLLFQSADGRWCIVDYKSDRITADAAPGHAQRYRTQMQLYAMAAASYLKTPPPDAQLYFLRPGICQPVELAGEKDETDKIAQIASELIGARNANSFKRRDDQQCSYCPYSSLCEKTLPSA